MKVQSNIKVLRNKVLKYISLDSLRTILSKQVSFKREFLELLVIKYLYLFLTVLSLKDLWYIGYGSYGIDFNPLKEIGSSIIFIGMTFFYLRKKDGNEFHSVFLHLLYILYYIPLNSAFAIHNMPIEFGILSNVYIFLILILIQYDFVGKIYNKLFKNRQNVVQKLGIKKYPFKENILSDRYIILFCFIICCVYIVYKIAYNGLTISLSISGDEVYSNRAVFQDYMDSISGTFGAYILVIVQNLITYVTPFYLFIALKNKKIVHIVVAILCVISEYSVTASKTILFFLCIALVIYWCYKKDLLNYFLRIVNLGVIFLLLVCVLEFLLTDAQRIYMLFVRRELFYPAWLDCLYYDFFSSHDKIYWTQNVIGLQKILEPVYQESPLTIISNTYFNGEVPSPNTGLFAEAYMHFGTAGVFIYPAILSILVKCSEGVYESFGIGITVLMVTRLVLYVMNVPITRTDFVLSFVLFTIIVFILRQRFWLMTKEKVEGEQDG